MQKEMFEIIRDQEKVSCTLKTTIYFPMNALPCGTG